MDISALVEQNYEAAYRFAYRLSGTAHEAEDLTQQAFLDAQRKLDTLRESDKARAWLFMIIRNLHRRRLRDRGVHREVAVDPSFDVPDLTATAEATTLNSDSLQQVLNELPAEFRDVLVLFYFRELSYREIAERLDVPIGTVMSRLSRGKQQLRGRLSLDGFP
ncbi:sigma-70 family RNA polymerase sigma factor [bacterium]|nr:sigma-70 family RNA polymerase sigma factor [bacterium]